MAAVQAPPADAHSPWPTAAIDAASHGAIAFCQIYYEAFDEPSRRAADIPQLLLPNARMIWNGNAVNNVAPQMATFLDALPLSRHDVQTIDCHPIPATDSSAGSAPDLVVNVTGSVLHGPTVMQTITDSRAQANRDLPRKFHEVFMLRAAEQGEGMQPKYGIHSSNFRFIG